VARALKPKAIAALISSAWPGVILVAFSTLANLHAQSQNTDNASKAFGGAFLMTSIVLFVLNLIPLIWVAQDAKARGVDEADYWIALVLFFSVIGLVMYLLCRPKGQLVKCPHCGKNTLQVMATCPHCHKG
jgi:hypothetical protein